MTLRGADARAIPRVALAQLGVAVVLLGAAWPVTKVALLDGAAPAWFALGRAGLALAVAALALGVMGRLRVPGRVDLPAVLSLGLLQLGGFFTLAHAAVAWVPAGRTAILSNATLVWAVPIALLVTREAVPARRWVAAALGAAGVVVLVGPWAIDWTSMQVLAGHAFLLGAALCWAVTMAVVRRWPPRMSMLALLPWAFGLASLMLLPLALLHDPGRWTGAGVACLVMVGAVMGPVGTWCIMQATTALPLMVASVGFLAGPAIGLLLSAAWLGEPLTPSVLAGAGLILGGAALAARSG